MFFVFFCFFFFGFILSGKFRQFTEKHACTVFLNPYARRKLNLGAQQKGKHRNPVMLFNEMPEITASNRLIAFGTRWDASIRLSANVDPREVNMK